MSIHPRVLEKLVRIIEKLTLTANTLNFKQIHD